MMYCTSRALQTITALIHMDTLELHAPKMSSKSACFDLQNKCFTGKQTANDACFPKCRSSVCASAILHTCSFIIEEYKLIYHLYKFIIMITREQILRKVLSFQKIDQKNLAIPK